MEIEDITFENIYFMKNLAYEATYTLLIKSEKGKNTQEFDKVYSKCLPSRQQWSNIVYSFPNANFNQVRLGEPEECIYKQSSDVEMLEYFLV